MYPYVKSDWQSPKVGVFHSDLILLAFQPRILGGNLIILGFFFALTLESQVHADFVGKDADPELRISIQQFIGTKPGTKGKFFIRAHLERQDEEVSLFCTQGFKVSSRRQDRILYCSKRVGTVDHEDDEALSFELRWSRTRTRSVFAIANIKYFGDGYFFEKELYTLLGAGWRQRLGRQKTIRLALSARKTLGVFSPMEALIQTSSRLLGRKVLIDDAGLGLRLPIESVHTHVSPTHKATVFTVLNKMELDNRIRVPNASGPVTIDLSDWWETDLLLGLNIN